MQKSRKITKLLSGNLFLKGLTLIFFRTLIRGVLNYIDVLIQTNPLLWILNICKRPSNWNNLFPIEPVVCVAPPPFFNFQNTILWPTCYLLIQNSQNPPAYLHGIHLMFKKNISYCANLLKFSWVIYIILPKPVYNICAEIFIFSYNKQCCSSNFFFHIEILYEKKNRQKWFSVMNFFKG